MTEPPIDKVLFPLKDLLARVGIAGWTPKQTYALMREVLHSEFEDPENIFDFPDRSVLGTMSAIGFVRESMVVEHKADEAIKLLRRFLPTKRVVTIYDRMGKRFTLVTEITEGGVPVLPTLIVDFYVMGFDFNYSWNTVKRSWVKLPEPERSTVPVLMTEDASLVPLGAGFRSPDWHNGYYVADVNRRHPLIRCKLNNPEKVDFETAEIFWLEAAG